jgi:hypothetical protein
MTIDSCEPDSTDANMLNRAIWHSVKGFRHAIQLRAPGRLATSVVRVAAAAVESLSGSARPRRANETLNCCHSKFASRCYGDQSFVTSDDYRAEPAKGLRPLISPRSPLAG